jgi:hypothetical protein
LLLEQDEADLDGREEAALEAAHGEVERPVVALRVEPLLEEAQHLGGLEVPAQDGDPGEPGRQRGGRHDACG